METINSSQKTEKLFLSSKSLLLFGVIISGYVYFFGYTFFRSKMQHLGFEVSLGSSNVQEIFYQAYQGVTIGLSKGINGFTNAFIKNILLTIYIVPIIFIVSLTSMHFIKSPDSTSSSIPSKTFRERILERNASFKGKLINISIFIGCLLAIEITFFLLPFILAFIWMYLFIPDSIGAMAAVKEIEAFTCEPNFSKSQNIKYHIGCTNITLKNHNLYIGEIVYSDDKNIYFINKTESRTIAITDIEDNVRNITERPKGM